MTWYSVKHTEDLTVYLIMKVLPALLLLSLNKL